jgi:membrane protein required for colicin V production
MTAASLSAFDWAILAVLGYSTIRAFLRGFLLEVLSLVGLVAGILLASWNYNLLALSLERWITSTTAAQITAFLLIAIGVMILCGLIGKLLHTGVSVVGLGFIDRLFGAIFGLVRGYLLCVALMMDFVAFGPQPSWITNSHLAPYFLAGAHGVSFVVPHDLEQQVSDGALQLKHKAPVWIKLPR